MNNIWGGSSKRSLDRVVIGLFSVAIQFYTVIFCNEEIMIIT